MEQAKRRPGDRKDGRLLRELDPMHFIVPLLYPNRCDNEAFISERIDLTAIDAYLEKKNADDPEYKYNLFQVIVTAVLKARMKSAVLQTRADDYLSGDLRLEYADDRFLRKDVVRVRRNEGSGGGRGGTSIRSSGFSHHSGKF